MIGTADLLGDVETPVALIDLARVRANASRAATYASKHGIAWHPHIKTHKSIAVARIQLDAGARGLTVATPHEAEVMSGVTDDLLIAYPPLGRKKLTRLMALPRKVALTVGLDSAEALEALAEAASSAGRTVGVLVEVDAGLHRVGVQGPEDAVGLARKARDAQGVEYRGIMFYPGHIRAHVSDQEQSLLELSGLLESYFDALSAEGMAPEVVSGGSSPTLWRSHEIARLTEVRAGTVIYNDRDMTGLGVAGEDECAYTVLTTVVSTAVPDHAVVDAGSKALSKEVLRAGGPGYAAVFDRPNVPVTFLSEEHGILDLADTEWRPRVGDQLRLLPNHVCVSVNLQDRLLVQEGDRVETWPIEGKGRVSAPPLSRRSSS